MNEAAHTARHLMHHPPAEAVAAVVLSAAGVLTSWASYQASLWDGAQMVHYSRAAAHRLKATQATLDVSMNRAVEINLFQAWVEAKSHDDDRLADFYQARFPIELREAFPIWLAQRPFQNPKAEPSPFSLPTYRPTGRAVAAEAEADADAEFRAAIAAKQTADAHTRAAVILAGAMFFGGIGQAFKQRRVRLILTLMGILSLVGGAALTLTLPMLALGQH